jgi:hypothetical protein
MNLYQRQYSIVIPPSCQFCFYVIGLLREFGTYIDNYIETFIYYNYLIFALYANKFSILAIVYWNNALIVFDKAYEIKHFSFTNVFAMLLCLVISLIITISSLCQVILLLQDSILKRGEGSEMLRKLFG